MDQTHFPRQPPLPPLVNWLEHAPFVAHVLDQPKQVSWVLDPACRGGRLVLNWPVQVPHAAQVAEQEPHVLHVLGPTHGAGLVHTTCGSF